MEREELRSLVEKHCHKLVLEDFDKQGVLLGRCEIAPKVDGFIYACTRCGRCWLEAAKTSTGGYIDEAALVMFATSMSRVCPHLEIGTRINYGPKRTKNSGPYHTLFDTVPERGQTFSVNPGPVARLNPSAKSDASSEENGA